MEMAKGGESENIAFERGPYPSAMMTIMAFVMQSIPSQGNVHFNEREVCPSIGTFSK